MNIRRRKKKPSQEKENFFIFRSEEYPYEAALFVLILSQNGIKWLDKPENYSCKSNAQKLSSFAHTRSVSSLKITGLLSCYGIFSVPKNDDTRSYEGRQISFFFHDGMVLKYTEKKLPCFKMIGLCSNFKTIALLNPIWHGLCTSRIDAGGGAIWPLSHWNQKSSIQVHG